MPLFEILLGLCLVLLNLLVKIFPRREITLYGDDSWGVLLWAKFFRQRLKKENFCNFLIVPEKFYGPELLSKVLSIFNPHAALRFNWLFSPVFDSVTLFLLYILGTKVLASPIAVALACVIYILYAPLIFHCLSLNARTPGQLLFNAVAISSLAAYLLKNPYLALAAVFCTGMLFNTHKMSTQALLFLCLGLSIWQQTFFFIAIFLFGLIWALIISRGYYLELARGHWKTIRAHFVNLSRNPYEGFALRALLPKILCTGIVILFIYSQLRHINIPIATLLFVWLLIMYAAFLLVSLIKPLRCIGQGYRYIEYAVVPFSLLLALALDFNAYGPFGLSLLVLYIVYSGKKAGEHFRNMKNDYTNIVDKDRLEIFKIIRARPIVNVLCIPNGISQSMAYFAEKKALWTFYNWQSFPWLFPQLSLPFKVNLNEIIKRYRLDAILLHTKFATVQDLKLINFYVSAKEGYYTLLERQDG